MPWSTTHTRMAARGGKAGTVGKCGKAPTKRASFREVCEASKPTLVESSEDEQNEEREAEQEGEAAKEYQAYYSKLKTIMLEMLKHQQVKAPKEDACHKVLTATLVALAERRRTPSFGLSSPQVNKNDYCFAGRPSRGHKKTAKLYARSSAVFDCYRTLYKSTGAFL